MFSKDFSPNYEVGPRRGASTATCKRCRHAFLRPIGQLSSSTLATTIRTLSSEFLLPTHPIVSRLCE